MTPEPLSYALRLVGTNGQARWTYVFFVARHFPEHIPALAEQVAHRAELHVRGRWEGWAWEVMGYQDHEGGPLGLPIEELAGVPRAGLRDPADEQRGQA